jgi:mannitol/fructose-specific phosphotransferase system IIA component (Ntr-type)
LEILGHDKISKTAKHCVKSKTEVFREIAHKLVGVFGLNNQSILDDVVHHESIPQI